MVIATDLWFLFDFFIFYFFFNLLINVSDVMFDGGRGCWEIKY